MGILWPLRPLGVVRSGHNPAGPQNPAHQPNPDWARIQSEKGPASKYHPPETEMMMYTKVCGGDSWQPAANP